MVGGVPGNPGIKSACSPRKLCASSYAFDSGGWFSGGHRVRHVHPSRKLQRGTHVNLAGDGGGDQRAAAFLQQGYGALGFGGEGVEAG